MREIPSWTPISGPPPQPNHPSCRGRSHRVTEAHWSQEATQPHRSIRVSPPSVQRPCLSEPSATADSRRPSHCNPDPFRSERTFLLQPSTTSTSTSWPHRGGEWVLPADPVAPLFPPTRQDTGGRRPAATGMGLASLGRRWARVGNGAVPTESAGRAGTAHSRWPRILPLAAGTARSVLRRSIGRCKRRISGEPGNPSTPGQEASRRRLSSRFHLIFPPLGHPAGHAGWGAEPAALRPSICQSGASDAIGMAGW